MTDPVVLLILSPWVVLPLLSWLFPEPEPRRSVEGWQAVDRRQFRKG